MSLLVYLLEAKELPFTVKSSYVKLQLGKSKSKTGTVVARTDRPDPRVVWNEEFVFRVHSVQEELLVSVYQSGDEEEEEPGGGGQLVHSPGLLLGRVRIPVRKLAESESQCLAPTWFALEEPDDGARKYIKKICGKILLTLSLQGRGDFAVQQDNRSPNRTKTDDEWESPFDSAQDIPDVTASSSPSHKYPQKKRLVKLVTSRLGKLLHSKKNDHSPRSDACSDFSYSPSDYEDGSDELSQLCDSFEDAMDSLNNKGTQQELPENLKGGVLLDQTYVVSSKDLNAFLFAPESQFRKDLAQSQGVTDLQEGPWTWKNSEEMSSLTRVVTYTQPPSRLVKAVTATEEQTYIIADSGKFAIWVSVDTPDVPYGNTFRVEILYKIIPGSELSSGEETSRLVVSWGIKFHQSSMMRGMIEGGARQGLKENFDQFAGLLSQNFKVLTSSETLDKGQVLENLQREHQSEWELAIEYFWNLTVVSATLMALYVIVHILLCQPSKPQGLEFNGLDLPDSFGELITAGVLVILLERVHTMVWHFIEARLHMGSDHGVKAQGDGWLVTVALIEAVNLPSSDSAGFSDPFVVFTCNGKTRTSSVQLQTSDPQWNEILEFDATEEPPSVLDVEAFHFDGPFDQPISLGHAEINFLKHNSSELTDMWIPLEGKLSVATQAKLHLRIYLENTGGVETVKDYLMKVEKEVGKKLDLRSPHKNLAFQKLFGLPPEEFLIKVYWCYLRLSIPLQGRVFLSARIVGFYSNIFGHKTKFFFLWEDIEDIEVHAPSLASIGSPTLVIVLRKGRGLDARHCAKSQDDEGRLRFYFQSFASFDAASRTMLGLWKARKVAPDDQTAELTVEQWDGEIPKASSGYAASIFHVADADMSKIYSSSLPVAIDSLMQMFDGGILEQKVMGKSGCLNYTTTQWEPVECGLLERHVSYKFNHHISIFGGEVSCSQRKSPLADDQNGWVVDEVMVLHKIPFSDHFCVHLRYQISSSSSDDASTCKCDVYIGVEWLKGSKFQERFTRNIEKKIACRLKERFELAQEFLLLGNDC